ncbi:DUF3293 domain-containing protein [Vibrio sinaloensis]|nr:DUF3293 domain-containing protein [Vibrio sinaloensis]
MIDAQLWGEYLDPYFRFEQRPNVGSFAIVTAWNPASIWLSQEENRRNNQQLRQEIGHTYCVDVLVGNESFFPGLKPVLPFQSMYSEGLN